MAKLLIWLSTLVLVISCTPYVYEHKEEPKASEATPNATATPIKDISSNDSIRFDFSAKWIVGWDVEREYIIGGRIMRAGTIEVNATLYNDNTDTVYFLSGTCDGDQYKLWYDTTRFSLNPFRNCNANFSVITAIPPKGQHHFQAHFKAHLHTTKIKLGFRLYQFDRGYDLSKLNLLDIYVYMHSYYMSFYRAEMEGKIIWADEKIIGPPSEPDDKPGSLGRWLKQLQRLQGK